MLGRAGKKAKYNSCCIKYSVKIDIPQSQETFVEYSANNELFEELGLARLGFETLPTIFKKGVCMP